MDTITIFSLIILLFSIIIHEIAHGSVAYALGDTTADDDGRLSLNPLKHLDPVGSIMLPLFLAMIHAPIIGWAKPVPVNPYNFNDQRWGDLKVAIAGPAVNFLIALIFGLIIRFVYLPGDFLQIALIVVIYNVALGVFNLIPVPPLDGSHVLFSFLPERFNDFKIFMAQYGFMILLLLIFIIPNGLGWVFDIAQAAASLIIGQPITFY